MRPHVHSRDGLDPVQNALANHHIRPGVQAVFFGRLKDKSNPAAKTVFYTI